MNENILDINEIFDTKFFRRLLKDQRKLSNDIQKRNGFSIGQNNHHLLTAEEKRISRVFRITSNLMTIVNDIRIVYVLINRFPSKSYLEKHDISELDFIKFHYEVFIHKIHTICELMKLLANEVLTINLDPKECNWANLVKDRAFNKSKCKIAIQSYYDVFGELIESRHQNSHRGVFEDKEMDEINFTYSIYRFNNKYSIEVDDEYQRLFPFVYIKYKLKKYKKDKLKEIRLYEQLIFKYVRTFLESLDYPS